MNNKVRDWKDGLRRYSPCVLKSGKRLICVQPKDGVPSDDEVLGVIQAGCEQYCPYAMDEEQILLDRNAYIVVEDAEENEEPEEP